MGAPGRRPDAGRPRVVFAASQLRSPRGPFPVAFVPGVRQSSRISFHPRSLRRPRSDLSGCPDGSFRCGSPRSEARPRSVRPLDGHRVPITARFASCDSHHEMQARSALGSARRRPAPVARSPAIPCELPHSSSPRSRSGVPVTLTIRPARRSVKRIRARRPTRVASSAARASRSRRSRPRTARADAAEAAARSR
jgi:hypothetical protein